MPKGKTRKTVKKSTNEIPTLTENQLYCLMIYGTKNPPKER